MLDNRASIGTVRQLAERFGGRKSMMIDTSVETKPHMQDVPDSTMTSEVTYALPSPTDTPYRTPSSSRSRQTSHTYEDVSPATTPPPLPSGGRSDKRGSNESMNNSFDESLPLSDPRRFTPTLHAALVSEILSLRGDVESRLKDIERLEQNLHDSHEENEALNGSLLLAKNETRQARRQMHILEGGTLSAIDELGKERDDALKESAELRSSIEKLQKKANTYEDNADRIQEQWQKDKDAWSSERRTLETKIHIVEGRLKVVLNEVAKAQHIHESADVHSPRRSQSRTSVLGSPRKRPDSVAARRQSTNSVTSDQIGGRTSVMSFVSGDAINLADELDALEDIEEGCSSEAEEDGRISPDALPEEVARPASRVSFKARKILGLPIDFSEFEQADRHTTNESLRSVAEVELPPRKAQSQHVYVDTGIQYSPPSSPRFQRHRSLETPVPRNRESLDTSRASKRLSMLSQDSAQYSVDTSDNAWEENLRNQPIMVSSSCQTIEQLPSPRLIPVAETALATIDESIETREIAIQTESPPRVFAPIPMAAHRRTDTEQTETTELQIPTIAIIPPTSRPGTPDDTAVKLPPRTKSAGCQVETHILCEYNSKGVQTEEIRIDKRNMLPPHPSMPPPPIPTNLPPPSSFNKAKNQAFARRNVPNAANSSMRRTMPQPLPPINDDGPVSPSKQEIGRPVRSSSMFAGFDEVEELGDFDDDVFHDDEFFNRPMTKLILSRGKIMAQSKDLDDIEESEAAVAAGKRFALEQIRRSEENERDFEVDGDSQIKPFPRQSSKQVKRVSSSRSNSIRRTALISSGTAAHQAKSSLSSLGSGDSARPPMPIPVRYSSARVGKSISDGGRTSRSSSNASPTRHARRVTKPSLRKTRSGPAISPAAQARARVRSQSPPLDTRVSIVPEMPNFRMPQEHQAPVISASFPGNFGASAPRPSIAQGPRRPSTHRKENSDAFAVQQTSVVDAIAQTMVGEWMFKYVRRRKSFGKPEKEWDPSKSLEEMSNSASSGVRHKRWVWLAPYERSVMWSSKQPTDGSALLGKSGRKLTIKSVLDVKDDNPMPKGSVTGLHFNRSILILTPQRALKFTATTQERHYIWLTALSFLSHSPISMNDLAPMPPVPLEEHSGSAQDISPAASLGGSLRRRPIRDSIRIAKGSHGRPQFRSFTTDGIPTTTGFARSPSREQYDPINDAAMPPVIRRYHTRNRSNTAPKPTASAFRTLLSRDFGPYTNAPSVAVTSEKASAEREPPTPSLYVPSLPGSRRGSEASTLGRPPFGPSMSNIDLGMAPGFFDSTSKSTHAASMTVHMDAFMADQQRNALMGIRGPPGPSRGGLRNLRLGRPSMRNLKDPSTSSWVQNENNRNVRDSMSPVEPLATSTEMRLSESTTRGSSEVGAGGGYFRGF